MTRHHVPHYSIWHPQGESFHALPRHGEPTSVIEWVTQKMIKLFACFPIYVAFFVMLTFVTYAWIIPLLEG